MLPWIMWGWNCNMENRCRTSFSGNLYQINYCEGGTSNRSIVWLGVITNITIDCTALSSRHWGIFTWIQILTVLLLPSFWHSYFHLNIKQQSSLWFWSTLASSLVHPFQGQEELIFKWNQPSHENWRKTKKRNSVFNKSTETIHAYRIKKR